MILQLAVAAQAIALATHLRPLRESASLTEGYVTQPMMMLHGSGLRNRVEFSGMLNLEAWTLARGELSPGVYGEGYMDRRHPHTVLHEAMLTAIARRGSGAVSLSAGKGFVPFGTDDPMSRPFVRFPANHHLAQVLERAVLATAVRAGMVALELSTFNGDEPTGPRDWPDAGHLGDSWSGRVTLFAPRDLEAQVSHARIRSPENDLRGGLDHRKWSASLRHEGGRGLPYGLIEAAVTDEGTGSRRAFRFSSLLAETRVDRGPWAYALRVEQTTRPEEERLRDVFRTPRPLQDNSILGTTRFRTASVSVARTTTRRLVLFQPFLEASVAGMNARAHPAAFDPTVEVFGATRAWTFSAGARLGAGARHSRMGRYGVAREAAGQPSPHTH